MNEVNVSSDGLHLGEVTQSGVKLSWCHLCPEPLDEVISGVVAIPRSEHLADLSGDGLALESGEGHCSVV